MSKKSKNIRKKEKPNFLTGLRELTNFISYPNQKIERLEFLIDRYNFDPNIFKRLISYLYFYPHLIHYWNTYFNDYYKWRELFGSKIKKKENLVKVILSFGYTVVRNNCNDKRNYMYIKGNLLQDKNRLIIKKLLKEYFQTSFNKTYNEKELNFFYDLFLNQAIKDIDLMKIDQYLNNGKSKIDVSVFELPDIKLEEENVLDNSTNIENNTSFDFSNRQFSEEISTFISNVKNYKLQRQECRNCGLFNSDIVVLDTNLEQLESVDIAFIGLNPGKTEKEIGLPFVGVSGKKLREKLSLLPSNIKWVIFNIILCYTNNESEIPENAYLCCQEMFKNLCDEFKPKYFVLFGASAAKIAGIKGGITKNSGKIFNNKIIPIVHPSSLRSQKMIDVWDKSFETVYNLFRNTPQIQQTSNKNLNISTKFNLPQDKIITQVTEDLTFFDVKDIGNNQILKIFIDSNGSKKYLFEDYKIDVYIKNTDFKNCSMVTDQIDLKSTISGSRKFYVSKLLRDQFNQIKEV